MCRVPAGPPPQALYEAPTWLGEEQATPPALIPASAAPLADIEADADADAALLDSLLLDTSGPAEAAIKAEPQEEVKAAAAPPLPPVSAAAEAMTHRVALAGAGAPPFLAGMFAGLPLAYPPAGLVSHTAAGQLADGLALQTKKSSTVPPEVERVKKRRRESAQRSRARKSAFMCALEVENEALRCAVGRLEAALAALTGRAGGESAITVARAAAAAIARQAPPIVTPGGGGGGGGGGGATTGSTYHRHYPAEGSSAASGASTPGAARAEAEAAAAFGMVPV